MVGMFEELLISVEDVYFSKLMIPAYNDKCVTRYIHPERVFFLDHLQSGEWCSLFLKDVGVSKNELNKKVGESKWEALQSIQKLINKYELGFKAEVEMARRYQLNFKHNHFNHYGTSIHINGSSNKWILYHNLNSLYNYLVNKDNNNASYFNPSDPLQIFPTKKIIIQKLINILAHDLVHFYTPKKWELFQHKIHEPKCSLKDLNDIWWGYFIKPEIDLPKLL